MCGVVGRKDLSVHAMQPSGIQMGGAWLSLLWPAQCLAPGCLEVEHPCFKSL